MYAFRTGIVPNNRMGRSNVIVDEMVVLARNTVRRRKRFRDLSARITVESDGEE
jgi:hypothetical protein